MYRINILGIGPGDADLLTRGVYNKLKEIKYNFLRTGESPLIDFFQKEDIIYKTYDEVYETKEDMDKVYDYIVKDLIENAKKYKEINYLVPGSPYMNEKTVEILRNLNNQDIIIETYMGIGKLEYSYKALGIDIYKGITILNPLEIYNRFFNINIDYLIPSIYNINHIIDLKLILSDIYGDNYNIKLLINLGREDERVFQIPLSKLDHYLDYLKTSLSVFIPATDKSKTKIYDMEDLLKIVARLRGPDGCPWDRKQNYKTLRQTIIEEAYEVVDAIDSEDVDSIIEELGDLLLQVALISNISAEDGEFNLYDITTRLVNKLIYRHPHVFKEKDVENVDEVVYNWNMLKNKKKNIQTLSQEFREISGLPSLMHSYKVQEKAANVGFDWESVDGALDKVMEEYLEVKEAIENYKNSLGDTREEELGDLLFAVVNVSRFLDVNPEVALNRTINKFIKRFEFIELKAEKMGKSLEKMTLKEMDLLWEESKKF